ncbi:MAG TPA: GAF domain-containing protein, partial [Burkholderiaceae bacterium]|nr:GAF domain-containing protein [Burkholderiaceae bacterium]
LFDETQRLLKETEARNAELAVINSIQQGISSKLDFQEIVDLVGDKLREVFASGDIGISWWDPEGERLLPAYIYEHGVRLTIPARKLKPGSFPDRFVRERRTFVFGCYADQDAAGVPTIEGTDRARSIVMVPMLSGDRFLGVVQLEDHLRDHAFGESQVRLVETIAAGMGVALQNALLLEETQRRARESSALSDVGRDLSATLDLATVMDRIARHAKELLGAGSSAIFLPDAGGSTHRAIVAVGDAADEIKATVIAAGTGIIGSLLQSGQPELINDTAADPRGVQIAGTQHRASERLMVVPLLTGEQVQGAMAVWRVGGEPFQGRELEFLIGLSRQAAIALHNARLFDETREALEQQRASAEVLQVISSSVADTGPVFERILASCQHLFGGMHIGVAVVGDDGAIHLQTYAGPNRAAFEGIFPLPLSYESGAGAAILRREVAHYGNVEADPDVPLHVRRGCSITGIRSIVFAPMLWEGRGIGAIWVGRDHVQPFSDKEMSLLRTFADQAVIAIQNARLFNETQEALERQTATAEVLQVISNSVADATPVFETILNSCQRLFAGHIVGLMRVRDDGLLEVAAYRGPGHAELKGLFPRPIDRDSGTGTAILEQRVVDFPDIDADDVPQLAKAGAGAQGVKSMVFAPLLAEGRAIGSLWVSRLEKGAFGEKATALLRTFADQAVIAIQNARLFNETKEALEQQQASSEILSVISSSVADTKPVFEKILESGRHLFRSDEMDVLLVDDQGQLQIEAYVGDAHDAVAATFPAPVERTPAGRAIRERRVMHWPDLAHGAEVPGVLRKMSKVAGYQSMAFAPMLWDERGIGAIGVARRKGPFTTKELAMLQTFADQA